MRWRIGMERSKQVEPKLVDTTQGATAFGDVPTGQECASGLRQATAPKTFSEHFAEIPPQLVAKVNGSLLEADFVNIGRVISECIVANTEDLGQAKHILDFGCGLGRVLSQLGAKLPRAEFTGYDVDPMMLEWGKHLLQDLQVRFVASTLELADQSFDFIYAISVFTHLDVTTEYWLAEIHRLLAPKGRAFITFHDETLLAELIDTSQVQGFPAGMKLTERYVIGQDTTEGGAAMGTFYAAAYWEQILAPYFTVERTVPRGLFGHQSFSVVTKKAVEVDKTIVQREYIALLEKQLLELRQKHGIYF
jgi:2-polyprenyl-3-methyl-5-hydroxy-6-metoxy-1,4-benzoquinol methylase